MYRKQSISRGQPFWALHNLPLGLLLNTLSDRRSHCDGLRHARPHGADGVRGRDAHALSSVPAAGAAKGS
jgi:hypothetical protein